ncbi:MAG: Dethiobiotin synthetase [Desertifilum sp. SIO1I2]|nr:Dethiobiotin synthetase [Desertifilum sp. SIO1I2]
MDYETARRFLITQASHTSQNPDAFLVRLQHNEAPIPGQVTSILLALKIVFDALQQTDRLDRELAYAIYLLATESPQLYALGQKRGVFWPPLLDRDIAQIAVAVKSIFAGEWLSF